MPYHPALVAPMREEMTHMGARELTTSAEVDAAIGDQKGTMLVFVNSVCGCAAGNARPALRLALQHGSRPQQVVTVFAGQDVDATARARRSLSPKVRRWSPWTTKSTPARAALCAISSRIVFMRCL